MNRQSFDLTTPKGKIHFQELLDALLAYNSDNNEKYYNDIHIKQEEVFLILEWETVPYNQEWGGCFKFVAEDEVIMKDVEFPDGHYEYILPENVERTVKDWHKANPDWVKSEYGHWYNLEDSRKSAIEYNIENWCKKEETENDSTFHSQSLDLNTVSSNLLTLIAHAPTDVLYRTSYIILGPSLYLLKAFDACINHMTERKESDIASGKDVVKLGTLSLTFDNKNWNTVEKVTETYHVYLCSKEVWTGEENRILFLTDTDYLIYSLRGDNANA